MKLPNGDDVSSKIVIADASHCPKSKSTGYAGAVIFTDGRVVYTSGVGWAGSSNSAESAALAAVFLWAIAEGLISKGEAVVLATDNHHCYMRMSGRHISRRNLSRIRRGLQLTDKDTGKDFGSPRKIIAALAAENQLIINVIQIPGHTSPSVKKRSLVARVMGELDRAARQKLNEKRMDAWNASLSNPATLKASDTTMVR